MPGFTFRYRLSGGAPTIQDIIVADAAFAAGDLVNLETGQADLAIAADAAVLGAVLETQAGMTPGTTRVKVITDPDAVYGVTDNNARLIGALLDVSGATGAQGVAAPVSNTLIVAADSSATEETLVAINATKSWLN